MPGAQKGSTERTRSSGTMTEKDSKLIVYLFGAGATQAEISLENNTIRLLMNDVREGILNKIVSDHGTKKAYPGLINELSNDSLDVEHLITLYEASGNDDHSKIARHLRRLFREEIQGKLHGLGPDFSPKLYPALIDMHSVTGLNEKIAGVLTLNYEDLLEKGVQKIKDGVDYYIKMNIDHSFLKINEKSEFPVLKLHGSFNWKNQFPVTLTNDDKMVNPEDVLWIPPGVEKRSERYPFSILWGRAREILDCDILRVIGCSLNRNDWQLVSLLYATQKLNASGKEYLIELINPSHTCSEIQKYYSYLSFRPISDILEVRNYIIESYGVKTERKKSEAVGEYLSNKQLNIFDVWLRSKGEYLQKTGISIATRTGTFENYIKERVHNENAS